MDLNLGLLEKQPIDFPHNVGSQWSEQYSVIEKSLEFSPNFSPDEICLTFAESPAMLVIERAN